MIFSVHGPRGAVTVFDSSKPRNSCTYTAFLFAPFFSSCCCTCVVAACFLFEGAGSACPLLRPNSGRSVKRLDLEITDKPHPASVFDDEEEDNEPAAATTQANSPFAAMSWLAPNARSRQLLLAARRRRRAESRCVWPTSSSCS